MTAPKQVTSEGRRDFKNKHYQAILRLGIGSVNAGLILSYLAEDPILRTYDWAPITIKELKEATGLSRAQQQTALNLLISQGWVQTKKAGLPATRYFRLKNTLFSSDEFEEI